MLDGRALTTSRKLAKLLGRKHGSILATINANRHQHWFKYGHFAARPYSTGHSHGYEFLITRKGLDALSGVMRYGARGKIADAYADAWNLRREDRSVSSIQSEIKIKENKSQESYAEIRLLCANPYGIPTFEDFIREAVRRFEIECDAKNQAYSFIISQGLIKQFRNYCLPHEVGD